MSHAVDKDTSTRVVAGGGHSARWCPAARGRCHGGVKKTDQSNSTPAQNAVLDASYRSVTRHKLKIDGKALAYTATAGSLNITDDKAKSIGNIFYIGYTVEGARKARPLTFVFNGGPGAASAYLHMAALGPRRVEFADNGSVLATPARLTDNLQSWLTFTDLVFVDPIGTGYSRELKEDAGKTDQKRRKHQRIHRLNVAHGVY